MRVSPWWRFGLFGGIVLFAAGRHGNWPWWHFGLFGGVVLSLLTMIKLVPRLAAAEADALEIAVVPLAVFLMGFTCGVIVWALRGLSRRFGLRGDAIIGVVVMNVFFLSCMLLFDYELLVTKPGGAFWLFGGATVIGLLFGPWMGKNIRNEMSRQGRLQAKEADTQ